MKPIVVLGSLNADLVSRSTVFPATGETVTGSTFAIHPGGKGANQAVAAARLGASVYMLGAVGHDDFGAMLLGSLRDASVNLDFIDLVPGKSGVALINTNDAGENRIVVIPGANQHVTIPYILRHRRIIEGASALLLQLEVPLESVMMAASLANSAGVPVVLDPAPAQDLPPGLLQSITWLTPNESETGVLLGMHNANGAADPRRTAQSLLARGATNVLLKRGESGAAFLTHDGRYGTLPAFCVPVIDTTAAGDAFNAGFAVALTQGSEPEEALRFGSAVAALSVTRAGAQPSMPTLRKVQKFLLEN